MKLFSEKPFAAVAIAAFGALGIFLASSGLVRAADPAETKSTVSAGFQGRSIAVSDLDQLADGAKLDSGALHHMEKAAWAKELPVAEQMQQGMCDCTERNWLNHFVETAKLALTGSSEYYKAVAVLEQLPRNDQELTSAVEGG
jgi:hypothetical protein